MDVYQGKTTEPRFLHYSLFVCFFPQFIAGPIVHHAEVIPQFQKKTFPNITASNLLVGLTIFVIGFDKKVFIADSMALFVNPVFDGALAHPPGMIEAWYGSLAYTFQLYFDFSGYSDMAIGLARIFGVALPLNFHSPYKATNIIDFWRRWHMTLFRFLRDYLYFPLGGNQKGPTRRYVNIMIVMLLSGLWHGAGWSLVFWGALHGFYLGINHAWHAILRMMGLAGKSHRWWGRSLARFITFLAVVVAWVFFRAADLPTAITMVKGLVGINGVAAASPVVALTTNSWIWMAVLLAVVWFAPNTQELMARYAPALNFDGRKLLPFRGAPQISGAMAAVAVRLDTAKALILIPLISGSALIAGFVALSRGAMSDGIHLHDLLIEGGQPWCCPPADVTYGEILWLKSCSLTQPFAIMMRRGTFRTAWRSWSL